MITKRIIPCLDVKNGRVVKGVNFEGLQDMADPVEMARYYNASGADELVFYDITASVEGRGLFTDILRRVASQIFIPLTVGGGINTLDDFDRVLKCGADKVSVNSGAIRNPGIIPAAAQKYGNQCVVLSADIKRVDGKFMLFAKGGRENTGIDALDWLEQGVKNGAGELVVNSIDTDGVKNGFDLELLDAVAARCAVPIIASGGAGKKEDFLELFRNHPAVDAGLAASIFHTKQVEINDLKPRAGHARPLLRNNSKPTLYLLPKLTKRGTLNYITLGVSTMEITENSKTLKFDANGLIPAIVQDHYTKEVLTLAYMNAETLALTIAEGRTVFWSRSRREIWRKGETSGNVQRVVSITADCDKDALVIDVVKSGPACHTGAESCFFNPVYVSDELKQFTWQGLYALIEGRKTDPKEGSYTTYLFDKGLEKILKKVGEESTEVIIAGSKRDREETIYEISDLAYHVMVLMIELGISVEDITKELEKRHVIDHKVKQERMQ